MQLEVVERHAIDDDSWNACLLASSLSCIYASTWFLDILCPNWVAIIDFQNADYQSIMPIPVHKKGIINYVSQPAFCQFLGIFHRQNEANSRQEIDILNQQFFDFFGKKFKNIIQYRFNPEQKFEADFTNYTHVLKLNQPYDNLKKGFSADRRNNLKRAQKYDWEVSEMDDIDVTIKIFSQNHAQQIGRISPKTYDLLRSLFKEAHGRGCAELYVTRSVMSHEVEAATMFWKFGGRLIHQFCAATPLGRKQEARTLLLNYVIERYANTPMLLDFETTNQDPFRYWNASFGGEEVYFPILRMKNISPFVRTLKRLSQWLR